MPPLRFAAIGLVLVLVEVNLGPLILSLDLVGWALVAMGTNQLIDVDRWFVRARNLAITALLLEVASFISPLPALSFLVSVLLPMVSGAVVFCLGTALLRRLGQRDTSYRVVIQALRLAVPLMAVLDAGLGLIAAAPGSLGGLLYAAQLVGTVALAIVLWLLGPRYTFTR